MEMFGGEKCLELVFEGGKRSRVPDVLGVIVPDVEIEVRDVEIAMSFAVKRWRF